MISRQDQIHALIKDEDDLRQLRHDIAALRAGKRVENLRLPEALQEERGLKKAIVNKRKILGLQTGEELGSELGAPPGPRSGFGRERTSADYRARIEWETWAARTARERKHKATAQGHDLARAAYERELKKKFPASLGDQRDVTSEPKFALGQRVSRDDGSDTGVVSFGPQWDEMAGWKWKVASDVSGQRHWWNETSMVRGFPKKGKTKLGDLDVADEIWRQLGRARVMIGAKGPIGDKDSLRFQIGGNPKRVKYIKVRLDPSDTYTVTFIDSKGRPLHEVDDIYSDNLARVIEMHTGLRTSL